MAPKILSLVVACLAITADAGNASTVEAPTEVAPVKNLRSISSAVKDMEAASAAKDVSPDMNMKDMESAITELMKAGSAFGATPMGGSVKTILDILEKTMMPKVVAAHNSDQNSLNNAAKAVAKCGSVKASSQRVANGALSAYSTDSRNHKSCRGTEAVNLASKNACLAQQRSLSNIKTLRCNDFAQLSKKYGTQQANQQIMKKAGGEKTEGYIVRISATICGNHGHGKKGGNKRKGGWGGGLPNGMLDKFLKSKERCRAATAAYNTKVKECNAKTRAYNNRKGKCNQYQTLMDADSCKHAVLMKDTCETYAGCYDLRKRAYTRIERQVRGDETDRKAEWRGLKRMLCLMKAFADGKVTNGEVNTCKKQSHSTKHLNIKYPKVGPLAKCTLPTLYPATGAYKRKEFKPLPTMAKGMVSSSCSGVQTVSTTPRAGSPKGTSCKRMSLNGYYSAGAIVKCTNGYDIRKSKDTNSCPTGTKLFSPRSRGDWKTFLSSGLGPLRAPHWIIDITRPQNGCGGCTGNYMNSGNSNQKSWTTADGSPWWLRSSKYSEPNGDYHANCYLNLRHKPQNENLVTFNDGSCSYHSKSYYCQPMRYDLKPNGGSPSSCKCENVDLTGSYSAGILVKCIGCLDVYKSTQKNSCPKGMKLFSPASRADWKVFIDSASVNTVRAPHFIIDITRPQNGCGAGCTRYPMKSTTPQQATWKTSDGSPWWLRNTRFGQPDGDYTANCFLRIYANPTSADTIRFNDHSCVGHSRNYYCQPRKFVPPPPAPPPPPPPPPTGLVRVSVAQLNTFLRSKGAKYSNVRYIEVAYGKTDYLDKVCKGMGFMKYTRPLGGDKCNSVAKMYPSYCGQGWLGAACNNGCGNTNYDAFECLATKKAADAANKQGKIVTVADLNKFLKMRGAKFSNVQWIEVAYGHNDYIDKVCQAFGFSRYRRPVGGDMCTSGAKMWPSYCNQGWLGAACGNGCGNTNYKAFECQ